jgi:hypothetical protein
MRPLPLPPPDEEPEPQRVPEERGQLDPPRRRPPTAIGLVDREPPPRRPGLPLPRRLSRAARVSRVMLGCFMVLGGSAIALTSPFGFAIGAATIARGTAIVGGALRPAA